MLTSLKQVELKSFKLLLKMNKLIHLFSNFPFILFFSYDFFNISDRFLLKKILQKHNLQIFLCKKIEIEKTFQIHNKLKHLLSHNTLLVFNKDKEIMSKKTLKDLFGLSKLKLMGGTLNSVAYRASELKKYLLLKEEVVQYKLMTELFYILYFTRNIISRINLNKL